MLDVISPLKCGGFYLFRGISNNGPLPRYRGGEGALKVSATNGCYGFHFCLFDFSLLYSQDCDSCLEFINVLIYYQSPLIYYQENTRAPLPTFPLPHSRKIGGRTGRSLYLNQPPPPIVRISLTQGSKRSAYYNPLFQTKCIFFKPLFQTKLQTKFSNLVF